MRILVTNDDGIEAPGLLAVAQALHAAGYSLRIAAPMGERSGSGSALGSIEDGAEVAIEQRELPGLPGVEALAIDAPPAFAVLASRTGALGERPDLIVSGINDGFNTGRMILSSSTVAAVLTAGNLGARGLAVNAGFAPEHRLDTAASVAVAAVDWLARHSAPQTMLNVNVPNVDVTGIRGVRLATLAARGLMGLRFERLDSGLRLHRHGATGSHGEGTDAALVLDGYVAVSVLAPISTATSPPVELEQHLQARLGSSVAA